MTLDGKTVKNFIRVNVILLNVVAPLKLEYLDERSGRKMNPKSGCLVQGSLTVGEGSVPFTSLC